MISMLVMLAAILGAAPRYVGPVYIDHQDLMYWMDWIGGRHEVKAICDNMRAVDLLVDSMLEVDPQRIGCIGHSLGGHNAIFTAFFDDRIKVVVSNCGFTSFPKYYGGKLKGWTSDRYMPRISSE